MPPVSSRQRRLPMSAKQMPSRSALAWSCRVEVAADLPSRASPPCPSQAIFLPNLLLGTHLSKRTPRDKTAGPPTLHRLGFGHAESLDVCLVCLDLENDLSSTATSSMLALLLKTPCSCQLPLQVSARRPQQGCNPSSMPDGGVYPDRSIIGDKSRHDTPHKAGSQ
jgi:hypothetical protein